MKTLKFRHEKSVEFREAGKNPKETWQHILLELSKNEFLQEHINRLKEELNQLRKVQSPEASLILVDTFLSELIQRFPYKDSGHPASSVFKELMDYKDEFDNIDFAGKESHRSDSDIDRYIEKHTT